MTVSFMDSTDLMNLSTVQMTESDEKSERRYLLSIFLL